MVMTVSSGAAFPLLVRKEKIGYTWLFNRVFLLIDVHFSLANHHIH